MTYKKIMKLLERAKKVNLPNKGWTLRKISKNLEDILVKLELLNVQKAPKKKRAVQRKIMLYSLMDELYNWESCS
jgi:hypothetical protein